jgi:hypothetical protein
MSEIPFAPRLNISQTDIANNALGALGLGDIGSFDDNDPKAEEVKRQWPTFLSAMITDHDWNFATRQTYLPVEDPDVVRSILAGFGTGGFGGGGFGGGSQEVLTTPAPTGFVYWYMLPHNFMRSILLNQCESSEYQIQNFYLITDETPALLEYIAYVDDPNLWDAGFRQAFEIGLASKIAGRLTGNIQRQQQLHSMAFHPDTGLFANAKAVDSQQGTPKVVQATSFTTDIREI